MIAHLESLVIHPDDMPLITACSTASPLAADDALREDKRGVRVHVCVRCMQSLILCVISVIEDYSICTLLAALRVRRGGENHRQTKGQATLPVHDV